MRKQAKKLVQKAKALQKSKQSAAGEKPAVRRSTRSKESSQINYCEDEVWHFSLPLCCFGL